MKITFRSAALCGLLTACVLAAPMPAAHAQQEKQEDARMFVDLRDSSLFDALDMVFRAAGINNYKIDDRSRNVTIGKASFTDKKWDDVVRVLANDNGFRLRKIGGTYNVDPKPAPAGTGMPGMPGMPGSYPGMMPGMPGGFPGANPAGNISTFAGRKMSLETRPSPQILPGGGRFGGNNQQQRPPASNEFRLLTVQHVYAGGIVRLFENASVLSTREFLVPEAAVSGDDFGSLTLGGNSNNSQNGSSNGSSGSGGFGGSGGSGSSGGFGGGSSGGFGGGSSGGSRGF